MATAPPKEWAHFIKLKIRPFWQARSQPRWAARFPLARNHSKQVAEAFLREAIG